MKKFKSLLSFALSVCLTSTTFRVLGDSLSTEANVKPEATIAINTSPATSIEPSTEGVEAKKNWDTAIRSYQREANNTEKSDETKIDAYKAEIAKNPNRSDLWKKIADIENKQQHYQNAIDALNNAIKLEPQNAKLYVSLSEVYTAINQPKEALVAIKQALKIDPTNIDYLNKSVLLANWAEDYVQAKDSYRRILTIQPKNQVALAGLQDIEAKIANASTLAGTKTPVSEVMAAEAAAQKTPETASTPVSIAMSEETTAKSTPVSIAMSEEDTKTQLSTNTPEVEPKAPVSTKPRVGLAVAPKRKRLATSPVINTPKKNNILSPVTSEISTSRSGYIEAGTEYDHLSADNGIWNNQYIKGSVQTDTKNTWAAAIEHDYEFGERAFYGEVNNTHTINDRWFSNIALGLSDNSIYVPKYFSGATISRKFLKEQNLVGYLGVDAYWWRPSPTTTQALNTGFAYTFESPWVIEAGTIVSRFNPGSIYSASYYLAVTEGREKEHFYILRYGFGKEAYQIINSGATTAYSSSVLTATWRQWIDKNWGFNLSAEAYRNPAYQRYGITFGIFRDFSL